MNLQCHVSDLSNLPIYLPGAVIKQKVPPMEDLQLKSRLFCVTRGHPLLVPLPSNFFFLFPSSHKSLDRKFFFFSFPCFFEAELVIIINHLAYSDMKD